MRVVVALLLLVCAAAPALADAKADKAKAAEHYRQGKVFERAKAYDEAIAEFEKAYALDQEPAHLFNIGIAYELKPDLKNALDYFQRYLTAQPTGPKAAEARIRITEDTQKLVDEDAKRRDDAVRIAAEQKKTLEDQEAATKKRNVVAHVKQAEAYGQAGAWAKAGEEHRAAAAIDGDPQHLLDAADAFHKQPDDVRARDALLAYLEKVPAGGVSDKIRIRVAELTKSIEKAETERAAAERRPGAALETKVVVAKPRGPPRRTSFGFELRGGIYGPTGTFLVSQSVSGKVEANNQAGPAVGAGAFVDFPLWTASHIHLGLRAKTFKSSYEDKCGSVPKCPTDLSAFHAGPAVTLEPSMVRRGKWDFHAILGFSIEFAFGGGSVSFADGTETKLGNQLLAEPELGIGVRFGSLSLDAVVQVSLTHFSSDGGLEIGSSMPELGKPAGILFAAAWALPR